MKSDKKLWIICMDIYEQMYKETKPPADFYELIEKGITKKPDWFMEYYLPQERQKEIMEEFCKRHKLTRRERGKISFEIHLGCAPRG